MREAHACFYKLVWSKPLTKTSCSTSCTAYCSGSVNLSSKGKELGWSAVDKHRRVRKYPTYSLRFLSSRTKRRLGTQRYQHALLCLVNAHVCMANAGAGPAQRLDFFATGGFMATTVCDPAGVRTSGPSPCVFLGVDVARSHLSPQGRMRFHVPAACKQRAFIQRGGWLVPAIPYTAVPRLPHHPGNNLRTSSRPNRSSIKCTTPSSLGVRITRPAACTTFCRPGYRYV